MFNIDYSRSAEKGVASEKTRQPAAAKKDMEIPVTERYEVAVRPQRPVLHELAEDDGLAGENEFHWA